MKTKLRELRVQLALAAAAVILGMVFTTFGALTHTAPLIAPGATLITVGGAWLGNVLARLDVRIIPAVTDPSDESARKAS